MRELDALADELEEYACKLAGADEAEFADVVDGWAGRLRVMSVCSRDPELADDQGERDARMARLTQLLRESIGSASLAALRATAQLRTNIYAQEHAMVALARTSGASDVDIAVAIGLDVADIVKLFGAER